MRAAGQNLKRLLKKRGWGRRPYPAEAVFAFFFDCFWIAHLSFFGILVYFLMYWFSLPSDRKKAYYLLLISFA